MAKSTDAKIDALTELIGKLLAKEVAPVAPIAPIAPVAPVLPIVEQNSGDHDALTKLVVTVNVIDKKVDRLQETMDGRLDKAEKEIEVLKLWKSNLTGKLAVVIAGVSILVSAIAFWISKRS